MATRERPVDEARRRARRITTALGEELRAARLGAGLSQAAVGKAAAMSRAQVGRIERAELTGAAVDQLARVAAAVGLELSLRAYPAGDPLRDAAHGALLERLRRRLHASLTWRTEVPLPIPGDRRAWDAQIAGPGFMTCAEAETRLRDAQALERRIALKMRDGGTDRVILLVADTRANRIALATMRDALAHDFPLDGRAVLAALAEARDPGHGGIIIL